MSDAGNSQSAARDVAEADRLRTALGRRLADLSLEQLQAIHQVLSPVPAAESHREPRNSPPASVWWPHAPEHRLNESGTFIVTAGTYHKDHLFRGHHRLDFLRDQLLLRLRESGWKVEAWAVFSNHYHFVAHASPRCIELKRLLNQFHWDTAEQINAEDLKPGRRVWFNYWESELTFAASYHARLNYVHQNAAKHGLVAQANQYPWCSAHWFETTASRSQVRTIYGYGTGRIKLHDEFTPVW